MKAGKTNNQKEKRNKHPAEFSSDLMRQKFSLGLKNTTILFPNTPPS